jgi:hypothetical protein
MDPKAFGIECSDLQNCYQQGGWMLAAAFGCLFVLKGWQLAEQRLSMINPKLAWSNLPLWARLAISVGLGVGASVLAGINAGQMWWSAALKGLFISALSAGIDRQIATGNRVIKGEYKASDLASVRTKLP